MENNKPLLFLPKPTRAKRLSPGGGLGEIHFPSHRRQVERLTPIFEELRRAIDSDGTVVKATAYDTEPEHVLVLETIGAVENFIAAVRASGMDWLGEFDVDDIPHDDDFFDEKNPEATLSARVFLVMANHRGLRQMLKLWDNFQADNDAKFPHRSATLKQVFQQLRTLRRWGVQDRLRETQIVKFWRENLTMQREKIRFEAELFFRCDDIKRGKAHRALSAQVEAQGGRCISQTVIREIAYHGVSLELPSVAVATILIQLDAGQLGELGVLRTEDVMFFRPGGQSVRITPLKSEGEPQPVSRRLPMPTGSPFVALLDGLPLANHPMLKGRVAVDDPDGWEAEYPAAKRFHGTTMASLIAHGELDAGEPPLPRPIYARPIMKIDLSRGADAQESIPEDVLPIDLTFRAVKRMMEGEGDGPVAPDVRIINLSIGDEARHFLGVMSPWARLIDWLSWKHKLLFIISAGNHAQEIELHLSSTAGLTDQQMQEAVLKAVAADIRHRKLLAPAESINAVTVGAAHADHSTFLRISRRFDPYSDKLPCPYSSVGPGYRRAVKPDILFPGGRQLLTEMPMKKNGNVVLTPLSFDVKPGQLVASPSGANVGEHAAACYTRGTSNAAALATRCAALACETLIELRRNPNGDILEDRYLPIVAKALLVHGARWGDTYATMERILLSRSGGEPSKKQVALFRQQVSRFIGYGLTEPDRIMGCMANRATLIGCGRLREDEADVFSVPLPASLSGKREWRRLVVTLAWFSPINPRHRDYRQAALWFSDPTGPLTISRTDTQWRAVQRGTVQHEVFESSSASVFAEDETLRVQINCRADAGKSVDTGHPGDPKDGDIIPYSLIATLEVAETSSIPVYDEVREKIQPGLRIRSAG